MLEDKLRAMRKVCVPHESKSIRLVRCIQICVVRSNNELGVLNKSIGDKIARTDLGRPVKAGDGSVAAQTSIKELKTNSGCRRGSQSPVMSGMSTNGKEQTNPYLPHSLCSRWQHHSVHSALAQRCERSDQRRPGSRVC